MPLIYPPTVNGLQKQLNADYSSGSTTVTLNNTTNLQNKPGICVVDRIDISGNAKAAASRTYWQYTGISGATLTGVTVVAGSTDQDHSTGAVVEFVPDVVAFQAINDALANLVNVTTLALDTTKVADLTTVQTLDKKVLTAGTISTGTALDASASDNFTEYGMARQAIINGNFDVWQRGTSFTPVDVSNIYTADRWVDYVDKNGGTLPTLTRSRQILTSGDVPGAFYYSRLTTNGAGTSLGTSSVGDYFTRIENGTRFLCGDGKKVTLSFWARSSIANKKLGVVAVQYYGAGGSPTSLEVINGTNWTLTSTWTKYTHTFTTNTLVGKTFGTNNDDGLWIYFRHMWGSSNASQQGAVGAETYVGSGTIDIAQVQLCAGDVALPFQPKSFEEELRACQRYYEKSYDHDTALGTSTTVGATLVDSIGTNYSFAGNPEYKVTKRVVCTPVIYSTTGAINKLRDISAGSDLNGTVDSNGTRSFRVYVNNAATTLGNDLGFHWTADAEL